MAGSSLVSGTTEVVTNLEAAWTALCPDDPELGADLLSRWAEPHRRYHTVEHLAFMLDVIERHIDLAENPDVVRLAAWFHDAVYDPRGSDNEERSVELARATLTGSKVNEVARLIWLTKDH